MAPTPSFPGALAFARDLIRLPSPPGREEAVARRVVEELEALGFSDARIDRVGNVIGRIPGTGGGPTVMLSSHLDVVAEGDPEAWEHPPFEAVVADGILHGRGAMDIKGPLAIQTHAAARLAGTVPGDVVVAHTVFEERGGLGMDLLLRSGEVDPDVVILGEATDGDICLGHRGRAEVEVVVAGEAGHASAPDRAHNVVELLPAVVEALGDLAGRQERDPVLGAATLAVTDVRLRPESRNVIPDEGVVAADWRILPGQDAEALLGAVRSALDRRLPRVPPGYEIGVRLAEETQTTWTGTSHRRTVLTPGFSLEPDHPVVEAAVEAVGTRARPWTFATDGGWTEGVHGVPTVGFAPGEERFAHTNRERLDLDRARWAFERYPELVRSVMAAVG